jgi:hypothetical protein
MRSSNGAVRAREEKPTEKSDMSGLTSRILTLASSA